MNYERELLKVGEVAAILGIGRSTVWANVKAGNLPQPVKIGGSTRWRRSALMQVAGEPSQPQVPPRKDDADRMPKPCDFGPKAHQLYRHFDQDGSLLYVGVSLSAAARLCGHKKDAAWFWKIARIEVQAYSNRATVLKAERIAIQREKPLHNIKHAEVNDE